MSLNVICSKCGEVCGYYAGVRCEDPDEEKLVRAMMELFGPGQGQNQDENVFAIGKVVGNMGCTFNDTTIPSRFYVCRKCAEAFLPQLSEPVKE